MTSEYIGISETLFSGLFTFYLIVPIHMKRAAPVALLFEIFASEVVVFPVKDFNFHCSLVPQIQLRLFTD